MMEMLERKIMEILENKRNADRTKEEERKPTTEIK